MKYVVYLAWHESGYKINYTHNPALDRAYLQGEGYSGLELLSPPAPITAAYYLWQQVGGDAGGAPSTAGTGLAAGWRRWLGSLAWRGKAFDAPPAAAQGERKIAELAAEKKAALQKLLRRMNGAEEGRAVTAGPSIAGLTETGLSMESRAELELSAALPPAAELEKLLSLAAGRLLFGKELDRAAGERNFSFLRCSRADMLQLLALQNRLQILPSIEIVRPGEWRCSRCGQQKTVRTAACPVCGLGRCPYCEGCINLGEARGCRPVYTAPGAAAGFRSREDTLSRCSAPDNNAGQAGGAPGDFSLRFELTPPQEAATRQLEEFVLADERAEALVMAVCGAGKTELVFSAMRLVLNRGGRVLLAIPRRDVVLELEPRIREAFPLAGVTALFGGCTEKFAAAGITIATTHQVMRFNGQFDLVILDEADAYPYKDSAMLRMAVERARKAEGKTVYMTATPDPRLYKEALAARKRMITIPARFHGHPLPEPRILRAAAYVRRDGRQGINPLYTDWLREKYLTGSQVFIFVPTVKLCHTTGEALRQALSSLAWPASGQAPLLEYSHAADPERERKRVGFKGGEFPFLLSTTIMERGITVANAHVLVLFADYERVFDDGTLIQMAGRAGRSGDFPRGEVLFAGEKITPAMQGACEKIAMLNRDALSKGYLR